LAAIDRAINRFEACDELGTGRQTNKNLLALRLFNYPGYRCLDLVLILYDEGIVVSAEKSAAVAAVFAATGSVRCSCSGGLERRPL
jgi:hypothetical protein